MEQFARFPGGTEVMTQTLHIRDRLGKALRLVDEIASVSSDVQTKERVTERGIQKLLTLRRRRDHFFGAMLFADPAWDILLELYAAELGQRRLAVGSLGIEAAIPATTTLRWLKTLEKKGMISRSADPMDGRRIFVRLAPAAVAEMDQFFATVSAKELFI